MPAKITFTQKEQVQLKKAIDTELDPDEYVDLQKLYDKMVAARSKETTKFHGVTLATVHEIARAKWGDSYKTPPMVTAQWNIRMQTVINNAGITEETARRAIANCNWTGDVWSERLIYKLNELASIKPYEGKKILNPAPTKKSGWLNRFEESNDE